ncbi:MAG: 30S ribosomal protein S16 [Pantoea sp. Brub]|nr:30S ribosomal protein S16 [Pantoea sp. Brub]
MMVVIRLARHGVKKRPFYQVVVTDKRNARNGLFIEKVGYYNPMYNKNMNNLYLDLKRITYWVTKGAKISDRVNTLIKVNKKNMLV